MYVSFLHMFSIVITFAAVFSAVAAITLALAQNALSVAAASQWTPLCHFQRQRCQELDFLRVAKVIVHGNEPVTF